MLKQYLSQGPELLQDLQLRLSAALQEYGFSPNAASSAASQIVREMAHAWGGLNVYFPKGSYFKAQERDLQIYNDFTGANHGELAKKYDVTVQYVYKAVAHCRAERHQNKAKNLKTKLPKTKN